MSLSVVVVNWNTRESLRACLQSVFRNEPPEDPVQVIVVDNASSDGSASMVERDFPKVALIPNCDNRGFAAAVNQGIRCSSGEFIMLLNPDSEICDGAIETLVRFLKEHPIMAAAGPRLVNPDGTIQPSCMAFPSLRSSLRGYLMARLRSSSKYVPPRDERGWAPVDAVSGACLLVRREVVEKVGPLYEGYFMYGEDLDWCYRIRKEGRSIAYVPTASVIHQGGESTAQVPIRMDVERRRSRVLFFIRHRGWGQALIVALLIEWYAILRALKALGRGNNRYRKFLSLYHGRVYHLLRDALLGKLNGKESEGCCEQGSDKRKVCVVTSAHPVFDQRVFHREIKTLVQAGYAVTFIAPHRRTEVIDGVEVIGFPKPRGIISRLTNLPWLLKRSVETGADLYHIHDPDLLLVGALLRLLFSKCVIYDVHEHFPDAVHIREWVPDFLRTPLSVFVDGWELGLGRLQSAIITADRSLADRFRFPGKPVVTLFNFPSEAIFDQARQSVKRGLEGPELLYVGLVTPERGVWVMLETLQILRDWGKPMRLRLVGSFAPRDLLGEAIRHTQDNHLEELVDFFGPVPHETLPRIMSSSQIGLVAWQPVRKHLKNVPTKIFEYMAGSLPIVASDLPPIREFIEAANCGILVPARQPQRFAEAILYLEEHPQVAQKLGKNGRSAFLSRYRWDTEGQKLLRLYDELLSGERE